MSISKQAEAKIYKRQNQRASLSNIRTRTRGGMNIR